MSLYLYLGPMWSSKTSRLISEYQKWNCLGKKTLVINHAIDDRYDPDESSSENEGECSHKSLYTHDKISIPCVRTHDLRKIPISLVEESEAIFINEGQFFTNLKETVLHWCEDLGKHVYIVGLDGDRYRQKFGEVLDLLPYADYFEKLRAKCKICLDGTNALFTYDQSSLKGEKEEQVKVGFEQYIPVCRSHYLELLGHS